MDRRFLQALIGGAGMPFRDENTPSGWERQMLINQRRQGRPTDRGIPGMMGRNGVQPTPNFIPQRPQFNPERIARMRGQAPNAVLGPWPNPAPNAVAQISREVNPAARMNPMNAQIVNQGRGIGPQSGGATGTVPDPVQMDAAPPEVVNQTLQRTQPGFTGGSFKGMIEETQRQVQSGEMSKEDIPFQNMTQDERIASFNRQSPGGNRVTNFDKDAIYAVVNKLSPEEYRDIETITDRERFLDVTTDTTLNLLEDSGYIMSEEAEETFKDGIDGAMQEWYDNRVANGQGTQLTDMLMGMTQLALAHIEASSAAPVQTAPAQPQTQVQVQPGQSMPAGQGVGSPAGYLDPQFVLENQGTGQLSPEYIAGIQYMLEQNPDLTYEELMARQGGQ